MQIKVVYCIVGPIVSYETLLYVISDMFIFESKPSPVEIGAYLGGQFFVIVFSKFLISIWCVPLSTMIFLWFISLNLGLMNFLLMLGSGQGGIILRKWMNCYGNGKSSKLWNRFWKQIIVFCILPVLITLMIFGVLLYRTFSIDDHETTQKSTSPSNRDDLNFPLMLCIMFIYLSSFSKNPIF